MRNWRYLWDGLAEYPQMFKDKCISLCIKVQEPLIIKVYLYKTMVQDTIIDSFACIHHVS